MSPGFFGCLAVFGLRFHAPVSDQLVGEAFARRQVRKDAAGSLYRYSAFDRQFVSSGRICHASIVPPVAGDLWAASTHKLCPHV
jgi:hypothetical protein